VVSGRQSADASCTGAAGQALTGAELRLLPLLSTNLSFPEIGREFFLSRHTIKSQAMSIYQKLGTYFRSQAVAASRELGVLASEPSSSPGRDRSRAR
jgi:LuxR family maltose regulon positive regulatory protein